MCVFSVCVGRSNQKDPSTFLPTEEDVNGEGMEERRCDALISLLLHNDDDSMPSVSATTAADVLLHLKRGPGDGGGAGGEGQHSSLSDQQQPAAKRIKM